jgi:hypothetical protein
MFGALHQVVPDRIPAAYYGNSYVTKNRFWPNCRYD